MLQRASSNERAQHIARPGCTAQTEKCRERLEATTQRVRRCHRAAKRSLAR
jgi:hypothetical protein